MACFIRQSLTLKFDPTITGCAMPILFWLPIIFMSALFEIVASPSIPEPSKDIRRSRNHHHLPLPHEGTTTLLDETCEYESEDAANLEAQIADLNQVIKSLRVQLAHMHEQMDR